MNLRSAGTSNFSPERSFSASWLLDSLSSNTSAIATSLIGPCLVASALAAAPVPRPPQPTRATRIVLSSAAWTDGTATPARADAAATWPVVFRKSRRDADGFAGVGAGEGFGSVMVRHLGWGASGRKVRGGRLSARQP